MSAYERGKVKRIREILAQKGISKFDRLRDQQVLCNIYINTEGEVFVKFGMDKGFLRTTVIPNKSGEKSLQNWKRISRHSFCNPVTRSNFFIVRIFLVNTSCFLRVTLGRNTLFCAVFSYLIKAPDEEITGLARSSP